MPASGTVRRQLQAVRCGNETQSTQRAGRWTPDTDPNYVHRASAVTMLRWQPNITLVPMRGAIIKSTMRVR
jgi:hypothetical protein